VPENAERWMPFIAQSHAPVHDDADDAHGAFMTLPPYTRIREGSAPNSSGWALESGNALFYMSVPDELWKRTKVETVVNSGKKGLLL
jgi:hypothetical protein